MLTEDRDYFIEYQPVIPPRPDAKRNKFITKVTGMLQALRGNEDMPEDLVVQDPDKELLSRTGLRRVERSSIIQFWGISPSYQEAVRDSKRMTESSPIFAAILRILTRTIAEAPTRVEFEDQGPAGRRASVIIAAMLSRTGWQDRKEMYLRSMLCEGGLSLEVVLSNMARRIDRLEYRPHESIRPNIDEQGVFHDPRFAYEQVDPVRRQIAKFAMWQIIDVNLEESFYHDRGIPHFQAARQLLEYSGVMTRGLMQKWVRESGSIEHFNLEDAKRWEDIDHFQQQNQDTINASPDNLVRQFFTKGKVNIERVVADARVHTTSPIEFVMELIFLASGVSKEIMGFKSHIVIRDMIDLQINNHYQHLNRIQSRLFAGLRKAVDFELLLHGIPPDQMPYRISGGRFEVTRQVRVDKLAVDVGAVSLNDIRRASNLPALSHPIWDIPGLWNNEATAKKMAKMYGVDPVLAPSSLDVRAAREEPAEEEFTEEPGKPGKPPAKKKAPAAEDSAGPILLAAANPDRLVDAVRSGGVFHVREESGAGIERLVENAIRGLTGR